MYKVERVLWIIRPCGFFVKVTGREEDVIPDVCGLDG